MKYRGRHHHQNVRQRSAIPRLQCWIGDPGCEYAYSGKSLQRYDFFEPLIEIRSLIQNQLGIYFNSVLANLYRDGNDSMGFHADDEPELGNNPVIASLSLGAEDRLFFKIRIKLKPKHSINRTDH